MSRSWVRRGASVLVGAALLGGSVAFGGGTALAQVGPDPIVVPLSGWGGSVANLGAGSVIDAGMVGGSIDNEDVNPYYRPCNNYCTPPYPNNVEILLNIIQGTDPSRAVEVTDGIPDDFFVEDDFWTLIGGPIDLITTLLSPFS